MIEIGTVARIILQACRPQFPEFMSEEADIELAIDRIRNDSQAPPILADLAELLNADRDGWLTMSELHEFLAAQKAYDESLQVENIFRELHADPFPYHYQLDGGDCAADDGMVQPMPESSPGETIVPFGAKEAFDQQMNGLFAGQADQSEQQANQSLEEIVEREMQQLDPFGSTDPFGPSNPYGPAPDLNPFGPMGPM